MTQRPRVARQDPTDPPSGVHRRVLPLTRGDCIDGPRPCPFTSCKHHLLPFRQQSLFHAFMSPDVALRQMPDSCVLDVAERGAQTSHEVGQIMGITRERVEQIEREALRKLGRDDLARELNQNDR